MAIPGISDAEDVAFLSDAFTNGDTFDRGIGLAGVALPVISSKALKPIKPFIKDQLSGINKKLGLLLDTKFNKFPDRSKIIQDSNKYLDKGLGIKKSDNVLSLENKGMK
jgi:hypothetical protein